MHFGDFVIDLSTDRLVAKLLQNCYFSSSYFAFFLPPEYECTEIIQRFRAIERFAVEDSLQLVVDIAEAHTETGFEYLGDANERGGLAVRADDLSRQPNPEDYFGDADNSQIIGFGGKTQAGMKGTGDGRGGEPLRMFEFHIYYLQLAVEDVERLLDERRDVHIFPPLRDMSA